MTKTKQILSALIILCMLLAVAPLAAYAAEAGGKALSEVELPEAAEIIGESAFSGCTALTSFNITKGIRGIGISAFEDCTNLKAIEYSPDNIEEIGREAFHSSGLTAARIFAGITYGSDVFWNCKQLKDVSIPASVVSVGDYAFDYCKSLQNIIYCGTPAQWTKISVGIENNSLEEAALTYSHKYGIILP